MKWVKVTLLAAGLSLSGFASAALVTLSGTDVDFTFEDDTLFGTAIVSGNSLLFQPTAFKAESTNGEGAVSTTVTLNIEVVATTPGYDITSLAMFEQGDYELDGSGASVTASGRLGVLSTSNTHDCGIFGCSDSSLFNVDPMTTTGALTEWSGGTSVDLADTAGWGSDTQLQISFQNNLKATTLNNGEQAFIQKKFGAVGLVVNPVPVPAAAWLFISGLFGLVVMARRKTS